jgi:hypothetical protein
MSNIDINLAITFSVPDLIESLENFNKSVKRQSGLNQTIIDVAIERIKWQESQIRELESK